MKCAGARARQRKRAWADPAERKRRGEAIKLALSKPEVRKRRGESIKAALADPKLRKRRSELMRRFWADPEVRKCRSEAIRRGLADPEVRKRLIEANRRAATDPEVRKRRSEAIRRGLADPEVRKRKSVSIRRAWASDPLRRARAREFGKKIWAEYRAKVQATDSRPSSGRRGRRPSGDDEPRRILELYNELTAGRAAAGGPRSAVWKEIKERMDREFGRPRTEEAYKTRLRRYQRSLKPRHATQALHGEPQGDRLEQTLT